VARLLIELTQAYSDEVKAQGQLPQTARYRFDRAVEQPEDAAAMRVQKTVIRRVKTMTYSEFEAEEVIRERNGQVYHSGQISIIVPKGALYGHDLVCHVGLETFLKGRRLSDVQEELASRSPSLKVPYSSLYEQQRKFLFHLGAFHDASASIMRDYLGQRTEHTWLVDGTLEPGTPVFFGIKEAEEGMILKMWKIATENQDDLIRCFKEAKEQYGQPRCVLHDLGQRVSNACEEALPGVPHYVCHYHLCADIGEDLYGRAQTALSRRLRSLKVQVRLRDQRHGQIHALREKIKHSNGSLVLADLMAGRGLSVQFNDVLGKEILLALHFWILDYAADGHRQGYPFDPYLLYLHRRIVKADEALDRLLSHPKMNALGSQIFSNLSGNLKRYLMDPKIMAAASEYEMAHEIFEQLRVALRLMARGPSPMRESYALDPADQPKVHQDLRELRDHLRCECDKETDSVKGRLHGVVLDHLLKYWDQLVPNDQTHAPSSSRQRTTNGIERTWTGAKRTRRRTGGRAKLTRDFQALPQEYMLVPNLLNPRYVQLLLGSLHHLPSKLAEAAASAGPFSHWRNRQKPLALGRLPRRLLRHDNFVDNLLSILDAQNLLEHHQSLQCGSLAA
jgi:hypothetical protein